MKLIRIIPLCVATVVAAGCSSSSDVNPASVPDFNSALPGEGANPATTTGGGQGDNNVPELIAGPDTDSNTAEEITIDPDLVANAGNTACDASPAEFQSTMVAVINESRSVTRMCGGGVRPATGLVTWNAKLADAANAHANDMLTSNFFSHDGSDGLGVANRADAVSYNWRAVGENIAAGQLDIEEVHQGWLDSPGHCRNIMNTLYTEVGAACLLAENNDYGSYWVVVFGDQPGEPGDQP